MSDSLNTVLRIKSLRSRIDRLRRKSGHGINRFEYRVFSQHREDGIISHIIETAGITTNSCIEFGFGPSQNNCLNLVLNTHFEGLFMDGKTGNAELLQGYFQESGNPSRALKVFLTVENLNQVIEANGFMGPVGVLSIDVDGNDYWLWNAIDVVSPDLVVIEYNASFGPDKAITVPYDPEFVRYDKHESGLYHGASLKALEILGRKKGYGLVGCDSSGVNAFFLKNEMLSADLPAMEVAQVFRDHRSRIKYKKLSPKQQWLAVAEMPYVEIRE